MATTLTRRFQRRIVLIGLITAGVLILHAVGILQPIEKGIVRGSSWIVHAVRLDRVWFISNRLPQQQERTTTKSIQELQHENDQLRLEIAELKTAVDQSDFAKQQLEYTQSIGKNGTVANIIGKSSQAGIDTVVLNRGSRDGIAIGQPLIGGKSALVGIIIRVEEHTAIAELMTSPRFRVNASVQNELRSPGIVSGTFQLGTVMEYIPQFDAVSEGQTVVTSGKDPAIPAGIPIGVIDALEQQGGTLFQRAAIRPFAEAERIQIVTIIR
jgi:rod shape-determining protein MreC